ncbi:MAG: hypothetical protein A2504_12415 [Bdellovibrionales bacterium RIFOXYD12_FULL_39_22]|nr:MAG: hypothetical protein A2385_15905 [Bdellovibrionales bacterium RIFOXYB1_FULL_39_21]OFZ40682.1 MAG: hypothetical protein A2485_04540 [Bdellovibrionales bacterium RIFOXYC12_FULL_39_17]OFZ49720.1 MAG: hypothetical protein A2404_01540 [Bdellovibrionales bacterium RIFOXYC1_FULL_39_130]OFZ71985.1 MAG: hypothetical protein A2451_15140 [Bdellovibrionales bacterium RIFOXYC2_FULL_39_8]OFZ77268.1 MAG: hypothetical protein A2560_11760 [Bdellovibrionales bacterium RIFOXYD1_FULL_39_84]OFZ91780.1 MAG:
MTNIGAEKIVTNLKGVVQEAEDLLIATAEMAGEKVHDITDRFKSSYESVKVPMKNFENQLIDWAKSADRLVRRYPYQAAGTAFGIGIVLSVLGIMKMRRNK